MTQDAEKATVYVDCDAGRDMGCATFCCRLLVRLKPHEMQPSDGQTAAKGFVDKDEQGLCVHLNRETWGCNIWAQRPQTCREYDCNADFLLQVVLREGFTNIADVARKAATAYILYPGSRAGKKRLKSGVAYTRLVASISLATLRASTNTIPRLEEGLDTTASTARWPMCTIRTQP
jgi:hypothetical protein